MLGIPELLVSGQHHFEGDFYGFERAAITLNIVAGNNTANLP